VELEERNSVLRSMGGGMRMIVSFLSEQEVRGRYLESSNESNVPDLLEGEVVTIGKVARTCGISKKVISRDISAALSKF
jgi:hypothetical protein